MSNLSEPRPCPRCGDPNRPVARFCSQCGLALDTAMGEGLAPGRVRHPRPAAPPPGFLPCDDAAQLYYRWAPSGGGAPLSGTESIDVTIFNAGYPLAEVMLHLCGDGPDGTRAFAVERRLAALPQGEPAPLEVPSYEIAAPLRVLRVALRSAKFAPESASSSLGGQP